MQDVAVLKLLYLVRYVDDVKANLDNLVILMADKISLDKISMRETVGASLERLLSQNYIGRNGEVYNFLTDEEQDIQRDIYRNTVVDTATVVSKIGNMIFGDIYTAKKYRYGKYDFSFDSYVDNTAVGSSAGGMKLRFLTVATDAVDKSDLRLTGESVGQALVVLADTPYYQSLENAMKVHKYVKQRNVAQLPQSVQAIIRVHQEEARKYELDAKTELLKAIENAEFYVDGERLAVKSGDAKGKIDQALEYLVSHVYDGLDLINKNADSEADIGTVLIGAQQSLFDAGANAEAAEKVEEFLTIQHAKKLRTSMADIQSRYKAIPYGWKELDIACVVAQLIHDQKVTVKYGGATIQPDDPKLPNMLHKKSEIANTIISKRQAVSLQKIREVREFLRDYFDEMDVPEDEDGLIRYIAEKFEDEKRRYETLLSHYAGRKYPDEALVKKAIGATKDILSTGKDNTALIDCVINKQDEVYDLKEKVQNVEAFFKNQKALFDEAVEYENELQVDLELIEKDEEAKKALDIIRLITLLPTDDGFDYGRLPELNGLMDIVHAKHDAMLEEKRKELLKIVDECLDEIRTKAGDDRKASDILAEEKGYFDRKREYVSGLKTINSLNGQKETIWLRKDDAISRIENLHNKDENPPEPEGKTSSKKVPKAKKIKSIHRMTIFPKRTVETEADIEAYVEDIKRRMKEMLKDCDGIQLE